MGDRNNPIKFGPEWLRNFSREGSSGNGPAGSGGAAGNASGGASPAISPTTNNPLTPKVQLAKLRYGREEILALYDRNVEPPAELKYFDLLYNHRGKPPLALTATFDEDMRDNMRGGPPMGGMPPPGERFGIGRGAQPPEGRVRGASTNEGRVRGRLHFVRPVGRGYNKNSPVGGAPGYPERGSEEAPYDSPPALNRAWSTSNGNGSSNRNGSENAQEWNQNANKVFRRWQGTSTNWRRAREEGEEWRFSDTNRPRQSQGKDNWDRDWTERGGRGKAGNSWGNNRPWAGDTPTSDDNLPEWAFDNMESCAGTFDSQGAFHGYSNDDSNLPKTQGDPYPLTRSHTQGSFSRSRVLEEGSDEWWASEKAKKLSPKRFDANDIKFKKPPPSTESNDSSSNGPAPLEDPYRYETPEKLEKEPEPSPDVKKTRFVEGNSQNLFNLKESKTFDALMRSDINQEEASDERGNFKSVMINANNSLRQKHQNIVATAIDNNPKGQCSPSPGHSRSQPAERDRDQENQQASAQKLADVFNDFALNEKGSSSTHEVKNIPLPPTTTASHPGLVALGISSSDMKNAPPPSNAGHSLGMNTVPNQGIPKQSLPGQGKPHPSAMAHQAINLPQNQPAHGMPIDPDKSSLDMTLPLSSIPTPNIATTVGVQSPTHHSPRMPIMGGNNMGSMLGASAVPNSLFGQNQNNSQLVTSSELHRQQSQTSQASMYPMHQPVRDYGSPIYNLLQQQDPAPDQWYYEDPKKNIQGPFSSKDMFTWYRAGFFTSSLMVRRAVDMHMRPLGSYGPVVPFAMTSDAKACKIVTDPWYNCDVQTPTAFDSLEKDVLSSSFPMGPGFDPRPQGPRNNIINQQPSLGISDVMNMPPQEPALDSLQFGSVGNNFIRNAASGVFSQQPMVDSLWSQPPTTSEMMWMQQGKAPRSEPRADNLAMYIWDLQASPMSNKLLPEEMKTEDQILAQLRASQSAQYQMPVPPTTLTNMSDEARRATPDLGELEKLIQMETSSNIRQAPPEKHLTESEEDFTISNDSVKSSPAQKTNESKQSKAKESEKAVKNKENTATKGKKKSKDEVSDAKSKEEDSNKSERKSEESSPVKTKKEDRQSKKELEKEKKEWIKEGFTIVKGTEKTTSRDGKKKAEELKAAEEAERKRKEEEKSAAEEEKRRKQAEALKNKQEQPQQTRASLEQISKKAPWTPSQVATSSEGLTLADIQKLEREKKLEQMKQQHAMMQLQLLARQQSQQREQEIQASLGWNKNKVANPNNYPGKSLGEIQAEVRRQQAVAPALDEEPGVATILPPPPAPWANTPNGGGFWDTERVNQTSQKAAEKPQEFPKPAEPPKPKKKQPAHAHKDNKDSSPVHEFDAWCSSVLNLWNSKIDVPTFVGFLKDIESPFEVKEYVKCYLGESKDSNDFARQFLERRCKLLRAATLTPVDDLCSPAAAINPRAAAATEYQEVKGKGKKSKKNKMLKVDARILGFSVTASEDRINVGDIDSV